ncbi:MAG: hypothetical protein JWN04_5721 [Myxococcaceae bacterium]|nr:hypothetical protein [Myxococcaceae bacterium]
MLACASSGSAQLVDPPPAPANTIFDRDWFAPAPGGDEQAPPPRAKKPVSDFRIHFGLETFLAAPIAQSSAAGWGGGLGFLGGVQWKKLPLTLGADFLATWWGDKTSNSFLIDPSDSQSAARVTRTTHSMFFDLWLRLQPRSWRIQPFVEATVGLKAISAEYTLGFVHGNDSISAQRTSSSSSSVGLGAGVDIQIGESVDKRARAYVSLGARWVRGGATPLKRLSDDSQADSLGVPRTTTLLMLGILAQGDLFDTDDP